MNSNLEKLFDKIGAKVKIITRDERSIRQAGFLRRQLAPVTLDVITKDGQEMFEISLQSNVVNEIALSVLEVRSDDRHLVLLARQTDKNGMVISKDHFLCGHDERHLFVAAVEGVSTVAQAKASLKPVEIRQKETGLSTKQRNRRKTKLFRRQGEWFFIPAHMTVPEKSIRKDEPLSRGAGSKPHIAQYAYRQGGETVMVCSQFPNGVTQRRYKEMIERNSHFRGLNWRAMQRAATVFVRGTIKHPDHATIYLEDWHRVLMNTERRTATVTFLD
jgi:hypothetical protein